MLTQLIEGRACAPTCVWMDAGVLTYKLCDRNFDCEHCPLDAALHGAPVAATLERGAIPRTASRHVGMARDRIHCPGHTWLWRLDRDGLVRFGVDRFAAWLLPTPTGVRRLAPPRFIRHGQPVCEIITKSGCVVLASPLAARVERWNEVLAADPSLLVSDPYDDGWIAELWPLDDGDVPQPEATDDAEQRARLDLRRFVRRVGQELLLESIPPAALGANGCAATDLRSLIDRDRFMNLLMEFIH